MGDYCFMWIECRDADKAKFIELGFSEDYAPAEGAVHLVDEQAGWKQRDWQEDGSGLPKDVPFIAEHSACQGAFGAYVLACDGKDCAQCMSDDTGTPIVRWDAGAPMTGDVASAMEYERVANEATRLMGLKRCSRESCQSLGATHRHTQTGELYCLPCARKINEANPGLVVEQGAAS